MANVLYFKLAGNEQTEAEIKAKIASLETTLTALLQTALVAVQHGDQIEYEIDTGQTKHRVEYTTPNQVLNSIAIVERTIQMYRNRLQPSQFKLTDAQNFR